MLVAAVACRIANNTAWLPLPSVLLACAEVTNHQSISLHSQGTQQLIASSTRASPQSRVPLRIGAADGLSAGISACACRPCSTPWSFNTTAAASWAADGSTDAPRRAAGSGAGAATEHTEDTSSQLQQPLELSEQGRSARSITVDIKNCNTIQQLQHLVQQDGQSMNYINLSAALVKMQKVLSNITTQQQQQLQVQSGSLFDQLWKLQQPKLSECGPRELANMIHSVCLLPAPLQQQYQWVVAQHLLSAFMQQLSSASPQHVSNVLYGLAASGQQPSKQSTQRLVDHLVAVLLDASIQSIANTVWAVATMSQDIQPMHLQRLLDAFCAASQKAVPQDVANTLWAVAKMQQQVQPTQLQQLLDALCAVAWKAKPQDIKDTLWAVATMQQQVQPMQLRQLLDAFCAVAQELEPQNIAITLWAVATMQQQVEQGQLDQMLGALVMQLGDVVPQNVSNTLWACVEFRYLPKELLTAPGLIGKLATANPRLLANTAWACGRLGYRDEQLMRASLNRFLGLVGNIMNNPVSSSVVAQDLANLCWSLAVLDMREHASAVLNLVQASKPLWASLKSEELTQLYQVHNWLTDHNLADGQGLAGVLTAQELQQCQSSRREQLARHPSPGSGRFQQSVFEALQQIPMKWRVPPATKQVSLGADGQPDDAALIDVTARTADGVWLAIVADGPWRFRRPDRGLTGPALYRNRALAVRGYVLISIPYYEWGAIQRSNRLKQQYMQDKITAALQHAGANGMHWQHL